MFINTVRYRSYNGWAAASFDCQERYPAGSKELRKCIDNIPTNAVSPVSVQVCKDPKGCTVNANGELVPLGSSPLGAISGTVNVAGQEVPILYVAGP